MMFQLAGKIVVNQRACQEKTAASVQALYVFASCSGLIEYAMGSRFHIHPAQIWGLRFRGFRKKAANMNATDARAYANQWDGAYIASSEPADIASLKRMYDIVKAASGATKDAPDSAFEPGPYMRAKQIK